MRVGHIIRTVPDRSFGFIRAHEFRDDVFFHFSVVEAGERPDHWEVGQELEFELNELMRLEEGQLQASKVRRARRRLAVSMDDRPDPLSKAKHHPRARQRKPIWKDRRPKDNADSADDRNDSQDTP